MKVLYKRQCITVKVNTFILSNVPAKYSSLVNIYTVPVDTVVFFETEICR